MSGSRLLDDPLDSEPEGSDADDCDSLGSLNEDSETDEADNDDSLIEEIEDSESEDTLLSLGSDVEGLSDDSEETDEADAEWLSDDSEETDEADGSDTEENDFDDPLSDIGSFQWSVVSFELWAFRLHSSSFFHDPGYADLMNRSFARNCRRVRSGKR